MFLGALCFYVGTAPARIQETYATENLDAARAFLDEGSMRVPQPWSSGRPSYPRHGVVEAALYVPFVMAARMVKSGDPAMEEWLVSLVPSLFTAMLIGVLYRWCRDLGATRRRSLAVGMSAALATMLWPYTAIGLEPMLSGSVLAAGYAIFAFGRRGGSSWLLIAGLMSGVVAGAKETGLLALPSLALLFVETWRARPDRRWWAWLFLVVPIGISLWIFAATRQEAFEVLLGGSMSRSAAVGGWQALFGIWGQLASPNKGMVFYAPAAVLGLAAWPDLLRRDGRVGRWVFVLALATILGVATRYFWADETWGPRYDHVLIAPLMLGLAVAEVRPGLIRVWRAAWVAAAVFGGYVALLGDLFWFGHLVGAMQRAHANELNRIQYDPAWNPIEFHSRLLEYRFGIGDPTFHPAGRWWFTGGSLEGLYIGDVARFEPLILYEGGPPRRGGRVVPGARPLHLLAFLAGLLLWGIVLGSALRGSDERCASEPRSRGSRPG